VQAGQILDPGTRLLCRFELEGHVSLVPGRVAWRRSAGAAGMGIEFTAARPKAIAPIRRLVGELAAG
jgi:hypothetical protein